MTELFTTLPESIKRQAKMFVDLVLLQKDAGTIAKMISDYINTCSDPEEAEFIEFYFRMRLEQ